MIWYLLWDITQRNWFSAIVWHSTIKVYSITITEQFSIFFFFFLFASSILMDFYASVTTRHTNSFKCNKFYCSIAISIFHFMRNYRINIYGNWKMYKHLIMLLYWEIVEHAIEYDKMQINWNNLCEFDWFESTTHMQHHKCALEIKKMLRLQRERKTKKKAIRKLRFNILKITIRKEKRVASWILCIHTHSHRITSKHHLTNGFYKKKIFFVVISLVLLNPLNFVFLFFVIAVHIN